MESHGLKSRFSNQFRYRCLHCRSKISEFILDKSQPQAPLGSLRFSGNRFFPSNNEPILSYEEKQRLANQSKFLDGSFCLLPDGYFKRLYIARQSVDRV
jgi:hypothetical protein